MRFRPMHLVFSGALLAAGSLFSHAAYADAHTIDCTLKFDLRGWSAIFKHAEGSGVISCDNGKKYPVNIVAYGGGLTVGKYKVENGTGKFSDVTNASDLFGDYAQGEASAGVVKSATAQVLTKGTVSLALAGSGQGVDLGISFGKFTISRAK
jgi:hypothetical protein